MILFVVPMLRFPVIATVPFDLKSPVPAPEIWESTYAFVAHYKFVVGAPLRIKAPVIVPPLRAKRVSRWVST